jgi:hypothetical protein
VGAPGYNVFNILLPFATPFPSANYSATFACNDRVVVSAIQAAGQLNIFGTGVPPAGANTPYDFSTAGSGRFVTVHVFGAQ